MTFDYYIVVDKGEVLTNILNKLLFFKKILGLRIKQYRKIYVRKDTYPVCS